MPDYYVQVTPTGSGMAEIFWKVDTTVAQRCDCVPPETHQADPGEDVLSTLRKRFPAAQFHKLQLAPGNYFPRIARPYTTRPSASPGFNPDRSPTALNIRTTSTGQLHALIQELQQICRVVHPVSANFASYGHEIRNIIIIACTEVEAHWKNVLKANDITRKTNTHDYAKLSKPMRLGEYRVALPWYPWLDPIAPFENWAPSNAPSQDLPWYDAYNHIKHDRETNFGKATLLNALKAVTGCFVMLCAQYGWDFARRGEAAAEVFFLLTDVPNWTPSEIYIPSFGAPEIARPYPFGSGGAD
ncbi:MAG TPA: hypothetical protein VMH36_29150 [Alphaproteobacteria bacterium]|nr:hypothetical protein [Alphaproteobacteria bacterium]